MNRPASPPRVRPARDRSGCTAPSPKQRRRSAGAGGPTCRPSTPGCAVAVATPKPPSPSPSRTASSSAPSTSSTAVSPTTISEPTGSSVGTHPNTRPASSSTSSATSATTCSYRNDLRPRKAGHPPATGHLCFHLSTSAWVRNRRSLPRTVSAGRPRSAATVRCPSRAAPTVALASARRGSQSAGNTTRGRAPGHAPRRGCHPGHSAGPGTRWRPRGGAADRGYDGVPGRPQVGGAMATGSPRPCWLAAARRC